MGLSGRLRVYLFYLINMNIPHHLVVGINGTIGHALFKRLQQSGQQVTGTTQRPEAVKPGPVAYLNLLDAPGCATLPACDVVYLCAGVCRMALCEDDPIGTSKVNVDGMARLARYLSQQGAFIIYLSTNQVFSGQVPDVPENASYQPLNEYGRQKAVVEKIIKEECQPGAIVRLTKVVEPNMALIQQWVDRLKQNESIEVFHDMMLAPVSLRQVVDVLIHLGQKKQPGCYAVSGDKDVSYQNIANYLAQQIGASPHLIKPVSALEKGIKKNFLPRFTSMLSSSTIALCGQTPPKVEDVLQECFSFLKI